MLAALHERYVKFEARNPAFMEFVLSIPVKVTRALSRRNHIVVRRHGVKFDINLNDYAISSKLLLGRSHEPIETRLMEYVVRSGDVAIDVGANIGWYTVLLGKTVSPHGRVIAFEPDPTNLHFLRENVRLNGLEDIVTIVEAAVGARSGEATLHRTTNGNFGDQRLYESRAMGPAPGRKREPLRVPVVSLDEVVPQSDSIRYIKMDIQGYEPFAIDGMLETLGRSPFAIVVMEFWPAGIVAAGRDPQELLAKMFDLGYVICELSSSRPVLKGTSAPVLLREFSVELGEFTNLICGKPSVMESTFAGSPFEYSPKS